MVELDGMGWDRDWGGDESKISFLAFSPPLGHVLEWSKTSATIFPPYLTLLSVLNCLFFCFLGCLVCSLLSLVLSFFRASNNASKKQSLSESSIALIQKAHTSYHSLWPSLVSKAIFGFFYVAGTDGGFFLRFVYFC